jgi:hypothetical protein
LNLIAIERFHPIYCQIFSQFFFLSLLSKKSLKKETLMPTSVIVLLYLCYLTALSLAVKMFFP